MISYFELKAFKKVQVGQYCCLWSLFLTFPKTTSESAPQLYCGRYYLLHLKHWNEENQISFGPFAEYREYFAVKQHFLDQELSLEIIYCHKNLSVHLINTT